MDHDAYVPSRRGGALRAVWLYGKVNSWATTPSDYSSVDHELSELYTRYLPRHFDSGVSAYYCAIRSCTHNARTLWVCPLSHANYFGSRSNRRKCSFLPAPRCASAILAKVLCQSVRPSVCHSRNSIKMTKGIELAFRRTLYPQLILHCVGRYM